MHLSSNHLNLIILLLIIPSTSSSSSLQAFTYIIHYHLTTYQIHTVKENHFGLTIVVVVLVVQNYTTFILAPFYLSLYALNLNVLKNTIVYITTIRTSETCSVLETVW
jgi:hypothetical protein